jgi:sporulation protein YlmC with PRC-barrel domain
MFRRAFTLSALSRAAVFGGAVSAQPPAAPPAGNVPVTADATQQAYRAKQILGSKVNIQSDRGIGTVDDIVLDDNGQVEYLLVQSESGRFVSVPWQAARFNWEQRTATVNITQEQFQAIPTFTTSQYPNFYAPSYRTQTYRYYGLTPGPDRRIDRRQDRREDRRDDRQDRR